MAGIRARHNMPNVRFCRYADDWCVFLYEPVESGWNGCGMKSATSLARPT